MHVLNACDLSFMFVQIDHLSYIRTCFHFSVLDVKCELYFPDSLIDSHAVIIIEPTNADSIVTPWYSFPTIGSAANAATGPADCSQSQSPDSAVLCVSQSKCNDTIRAWNS